MRKVNIIFLLHLGAIRITSTSGSQTPPSLQTSFSTNITSVTTTPKIPGKDADFGTQATIKTFYEGKNSCPGHYDWVDSPPKQVRRPQNSRADVLYTFLTFRCQIMLFLILSLAGQENRETARSCRNQDLQSQRPCSRDSLWTHTAKDPCHRATKSSSCRCSQGYRQGRECLPRKQRDCEVSGAFQTAILLL